MHRDTKVGLALGVLLVGVVAAFFFRNEGRAQNDVPALADPASVDASISERDVIPYLGDGGETAAIRAADDDEPHWRLPDFLRTDDESTAGGAFDRLPPVDDADFPSAPSNRRESTPSSRDVVRDEAGAEFYVVQSGDTLTGIASRVLGSSSRYDELFEANRDVLASPDRLQLGQKLRIPGRGSSAQGLRRPANVARRESPNGTTAVPVSSSERPAAVPASSGSRTSTPTDERTLDTDEWESFTIEEVDDAPGAVPSSVTETGPATSNATPTEGAAPKRRFVPVRRSPYTGTRR